MRVEIRLSSRLRRTQMAARSLKAEWIRGGTVLIGRVDLWMSHL